MESLAVGLVYSRQAIQPDVLHVEQTTDQSFKGRALSDLASRCHALCVRSTAVAFRGGFHEL